MSCSRAWRWCARWHRSGRGCVVAAPPCIAAWGGSTCARAIPAAVCAMVIGAATPFGPILAVSNVAAGVAVAVVHRQRLSRRSLPAVRSASQAHGAQRRHSRCRSSPTASGLRYCSSRCTRCRTVPLAATRSTISGSSRDIGAWLGWTVPTYRRLPMADAQTGNAVVVKFSASAHIAGVISGRLGTTRRRTTRTRLGHGNRIQRQDRARHPRLGARLGAVRRADRARRLAQRPVPGLGRHRASRRGTASAVWSRCRR